MEQQHFRSSKNHFFLVFWVNCSGDSFGFGDEFVVFENFMMSNLSRLSRGMRQYSFFSCRDGCLCGVPRFEPVTSEFCFVARTIAQNGAQYLGKFNPKGHPK